MHINFVEDDSIPYSFYRAGDNPLMQAVGRAADYCLGSKVFSLLTLGHLHALIHELGHAVAHRILTGGRATINLYTSYSLGSTTCHEGPRPISSIGATWIDLSGPLADIIFSLVLIVGIFALTQYVPMSQGLSLGLRVGIGAPAAIWIFGEFFYAGVSTSRADDGDFGKISSRGKSHLLVSFAILVTLCALAALGIAMLL